MFNSNSDGGGKTEASRRNFLRGLGALPLAAFAGEGSRPGWQAARVADKARSNPVETPARRKKLVAIQIGARSFVDEGVDKCLDTLEEKARVNVLMSTVFTYGRGLAGRQVPGRPAEPQPPAIRPAPGPRARRLPRRARRLPAARASVAAS